MNYKNLLQHLAEIIRFAANEELLPRYEKIERNYKADGSIVTEADFAMQKRLINELQQHWPEIPLLGEEMSESEQQALVENSQQGLWVLDPLDGTNNFAAGIPCFAVSLALVVERKVVLGLVYDPLRNECFSAIAGEGVWLNDQPLKPRESDLPLSKCVALLDLKRLPKGMVERLVSSPPFASQRSFGSGVLDWCWLAAGRVHVYLHGQQKLWDYSAGQLILKEAGGHSCTLQGEPVFRGKMEGRSVLAALSERNFEEWKKAVLG